jgi:hypothetical protein
VTITIDPADPRSIRALEVLQTADRWQRCRTRSGRKAYAVPSQSHENAFHLVDCFGCSCQDFLRRRQLCKHVLAVRLHVTRIKGQRPHRDVGQGARTSEGTHP